MHVSHYLLLGFFSGPDAGPPLPPGGAAPGRKPQPLPRPRPAWMITDPVVIPGPADVEEEDALLLCGVLS